MRGEIAERGQATDSGNFRSSKIQEENHRYEKVKNADRKNKQTNKQGA